MSPAASLPHQSGIRETPVSREKCRLTVVMACSAVTRQRKSGHEFDLRDKIILDSGKCMVNVLYVLVTKIKSEIKLGFTTRKFNVRR